VALAGEREFRDGMTLTQAIMAAGGVSRAGKIEVRISRQNGAGFLSATDYSLQSIQAGKSQDPLLEAGDRIEVTRSM
jgi:protein involved in polysaccharide export with SLBB domain